MGAAFQATVICLILLHGCNAAAQDDEWKSATATYSKETDGSIIIEGACGYGDLHMSSYGKYSAGLSSMLFNRGSTCGSCFEVRCVDHILWCLQGSPSVTLTATDFCPPNYGLPADYGGWCNFPRAHFEMSKAAFAEIAEKRADIVPVQYRRVKCERRGAIRFTVYGTSFYYQVLITNVGSDGEVVGVKVKGSKTGWIPMGRNWGQNWQCNLNLSGQPLSFEVTTSTGRTVTSYNVAPPTSPVPRNKNEWSAKVPPTNFRAAMSPASTTEAVPCISLLNTRVSCTIFRQQLKCFLVCKIFKLIEDLERERTGRVFQNLSNLSRDASALQNRITGGISACLGSWKRVKASPELPLLILLKDKLLQVLYYYYYFFDK